MNEDRSDVRWLQDQYDAAAHQVPDRDGWAPDPMHEPSPEDIADNYNWSNQ